jgi:hypothetical protein
VNKIHFLLYNDKKRTKKCVSVILIVKNNLTLEASIVHYLQFLLSVTQMASKSLRGQSHDIFDPLFFCSAVPPDSWAVSDIDSYSRIYSIRFEYRFHAMLNSAESICFVRYR